MGLDSRAVTPELTRAVVHLSAEVRSFERAEITTEKVLTHKVPRSTIRRLAKQVGQELSEQNDHEPRRDVKEVVVPELAVVSCDGGRIRTRQTNQGRGVKLSGERGWRETKNASFERMCIHDKHVSHEDSCPTLPTSFRIAKKVANITEKPVPDTQEATADEDGQPPDSVKYQGPQRVLRTAVSSMACSEEFGPMMQREARRRRFYESALQAFLGDGLNWNWSIWKKYFPTFVPILDFIHAIQYIFNVAMALASNDAQAWEIYLQLVTLCWQGQVDSVIEQLREACEQRGIDPEAKLGEGDVYQPLIDAVRYLTNNPTRMDYPRYRRMGLPVTSAPMESLIKQINHRVKGTEMFWDDPDGAEAILQLRAAALSEDERLDRYLSHRPGWPFHRRTTTLTTAS